jgi:hypothetical protein
MSGMFYTKSPLGQRGIDCGGQNNWLSIFFLGMLLARRSHWSVSRDMSFGRVGAERHLKCSILRRKPAMAKISTDRLLDPDASFTVRQIATYALSLAQMNRLHYCAVDMTGNFAQL